MKVQTAITLTAEAKKMLEQDSKSIGLTGSTLIEKLIRENHARMQKEKKNAKA